MIRLLVGFLIMFGAVGGLEVGDSSILESVIIGAIGSIIGVWPIVDGTVQRIADESQ